MAKMVFLAVNNFSWCVFKNTEQNNNCVFIVFKAESKPKHEEKFCFGFFYCWMILYSRLKSRESRWERKVCMFAALDEGNLYMDEKIAFLLLKVTAIDKHSNNFGMKVEKVLLRPTTPLTTGLAQMLPAWLLGQLIDSANDTTVCRVQLTQLSTSWLCWTPTNSARICWVPAPQT